MKENDSADGYQVWFHRSETQFSVLHCEYVPQFTAWCLASVGNCGALKPQQIVGVKTVKTYRMNSFMAGSLYILGTIFGVVAAATGGQIVSSSVTDQGFAGGELLRVAAEDASGLSGAALLILLMGISLASMTIFLYPLFRQDSEELALGMLLFRGALEGVYYFLVALVLLTMAALGTEYVATGSDIAALRAMGHVLLKLQGFVGHGGTFLFLVGAICLYVSFYRTRLIPRWLAIWGLIGVVPYMANAALHILSFETGGIGLYIEMPLAVQEIVMGLWLLIAGFNKEALKALGEDASP